MTKAGAVVPDGDYNIQFKIYQDGTGAAVNNPGGSLKWTETYVNNGGTSGIQVKNGFFSVGLGSVNTFGTSVDWDANTLFLSMNVAGKATACATFGSAPCAADGEMLPMKQITATPYAINSGAVGGKTADNFVQLAQGVQTDASNNTSSVFINKTGTGGNLVQLQNAGEDIFTVTNSGDLALGRNADREIYVSGSDTDVAGGRLAITAGNGGSGGAGASGGNLVLQGGAAGGENADGGNIGINAGAGTGTGTDGYIAIGTSNTSGVTIGNVSNSITQDIGIGVSEAAGSISNVKIGAGGTAAGGTTTIRAKNEVTIETNGTARATFSDDTNAVYFGNGVSSATPDDYTIQGTNSSATSVAGGTLTVQGGNATAGDANGGNVVLAGGSASGDGADGLVVLSTPTFSTVTSDANCYTNGAVVASSCTLTSSSLNKSSAALIGFSATGQTATLPDPTIKTAGRVFYVMAAGDSQDFTLSVNGGGAGNKITMRKNNATTLLWNGSDWVAAGGSSSTTLQDAYDNTPQETAGSEIVLNNDEADGLTVRDSSDNPDRETILTVKDSENDKLFSVNNKVTDGTELVSDGSVSDNPNFATNWSAVGTAAVNRITIDGQGGSDSAEVIAGTAAGNGIRNKLALNPGVSKDYSLAVYAKLAAGSSFTDLTLRYSPDDGANFVNCTNYQNRTVTSSGWTKVTCDITTSSTAATDPYLYITQPTESTEARTFLVDTLSMTLAPNDTPNVKVGGGKSGSKTTLFTLDKASSAPTTSGGASLAGSMYYDTTVGKVQCFEAEGWGACGASPDIFVTLSPEYSNAVVNGNDIGEISSDLCSDELNINDGSNSQPTICSSTETYNFYKWTSSETSAQTRSIYVTYQLPDTFKNFATGKTSLMGRTDSADSTVSYQVYKDQNNSGLTSCGSTLTVSTDPQTSWQKASVSGGADPASCGFKAGDSVLIRINLTASNDANAYASNLSFVFSNK